jgi:uncharacterized membrane protein
LANFPKFPTNDLLASFIFSALSLKFSELSLIESDNLFRLFKPFSNISLAKLLPALFILSESSLENSSPFCSDLASSVASLFLSPSSKNIVSII